MEKISEKALDKAIDEAFKTSPEFVDWFLSKTKFASRNAKYHWSRSNHPWGPVPISIHDPITGIEEVTVMEGETDVLVVFETEDAKRFAVHIENKLTSKFTKLQPELYAARAKHWLNKPMYRDYSDFETVLIAPRDFYERYKSDAVKFDQFISHEDISAYVPMFVV